MIVKPDTPTGRALLLKEATARVAALSLSSEFKAQLPVGTHFLLADYPRKNNAYIGEVVGHSPELGELIARRVSRLKIRRIPYKLLLNAIRNGDLEITNKGKQP